MTTQPQFPLLGEPLALDLVNTRIRWDDEETDLLATPLALRAWLHAERARIGWSGMPNAADVAAVHALRGAIDALLRACRKRTRPPAAAVGRLNRVLALAPAPARLSWQRGQPTVRPPSRRAQRAALLQAIATDAVRLVTGPLRRQIRECAHPDCRLQFVASNARRQWCSASTCGNRARVARHYRRQQGDA